MSKSKSDVEPLPVNDTPSASNLTPAPGPVEPVHLFRDKVFTSRTLILPDCQPLTVTKGLVAVVADEQRKFLSSHPDFEPVKE
ncbi:hypothetical protein IFT48_17190 [Pseudomonas fluorescens]|uniref:hypothetical protein n=1 Tax=Pseudomonas fluorescens TaxID=294 RepID=UPI001908BDFC|nr:hypothetical protein [Pseudomonas fluorescens]MBD8091730.1 hypothetical protein [Pseudomonas fluorescens]MBD8716147.1 hypothetical protein [Pseudomonas fluorescens]